MTAPAAAAREVAELVVAVRARYHELHAVGRLPSSIGSWAADEVEHVKALLVDHADVAESRTILCAVIGALDALARQAEEDERGKG